MSKEFEMIVARLEQEIKYMGGMLQKEVARCAKKFHKTENTFQYIRDIADILEKFDEFVKKHARSIQKRIEDAGLQDEYVNTLQKLRALSGQESVRDAQSPARDQSLPETDKICHEAAADQLASDNVDAQSAPEPNQEEKCIPDVSDPVQSTQKIESVPIMLSSDSDVELNLTQPQNISPSSPNSDNMSVNSDETVKLHGSGEIDSDATILDPVDVRDFQQNSDSAENSDVFNGAQPYYSPVVDLTTDDRGDTSVHLQPNCETASNERGEDGDAKASYKSSEQLEELFQQINSDVFPAGIKKMLNEKDKKCLFRVIEKFYKHLHKRRPNSDSSSDEAPEPVKKRKKLRKKSSNGAQRVAEKAVKECSVRLVRMDFSTVAPAADSCATDSEEAETLVVKFRRKKCRPLSTDDSENQLGSEQEKTDSKLQDSKSNFEFSPPNHSAAKRRKLATTGDASVTSFCMNSQARDSFLDMLIEKNSLTQKALDSKKITADMNDSPVDNLLQTPKTEWDGAAEDALLKTDSDEETENHSIPSGGCQPFKFTESQRSKLLDLLSGVVENGAILNVSREELNQLLSEFEESVRLNVEKEIEERGESSDPENDLLTVLREEVISAKRSPGRPRKNLESWNAFNTLMKSEDDMSDSSVSASLLLSDLEEFSDQEHQVKPAKVAQWDQKSELRNELIVKVARLSLSKFETSQSSDSDDRSSSSPTSSPGRNRLRSFSSEYSGLSFSSVIGSDVSSDSDSPDSESAGDVANLARSLWDNICSSGDESNLASSSSDKESSLKSASSDRKQKGESADVQKSTRKRAPSWCADPLLRADLISDENKQEPNHSKTGNSFSSLASDSDRTHVEEPKHSKKDFIADLSDDSDFEIIEGHKTPEEAIIVTDEEESGSSKTGKGRRNIRALVEDRDLAEATQRANNEERERIKRLQERDKSKDSSIQTPEENEENPLILDAFDSVEVKVHAFITKKLKPHQRNGIQFMWDSCYESIKQLKMGYMGSGCILAHCMGLGKTLQALALVEALFRNPITNTKHVLVVCPLSTVSNRRNEFNLAYGGIRDLNIKLFAIENKRTSIRKFHIVREWRSKGGILMLGYECFGMMINPQKLDKLEKAGINKTLILQALVDPGPDLVICDEGHLLRNKQSQRTLAMHQIKTKRRIVLTGTPLQNNLLEYFCMVNFVKPSLLGTEKEYKTNFANPITNGQFEDSTAEDIMFMKKRTHVLHKILHRTVQRVEDTELKLYLPKLIDQAVFIQMSDLQVNLYNTYLDSAKSLPIVYTQSGTINRKNFLADVQVLQYICNHPNVLTTAETTSRAKIKEQDVIEDHLEVDVGENVLRKGDWHKELLSLDGTRELRLGTKFLVAVGIVQEAAAVGDKVLIFAHSYAEMDNLELFLSQNLHFVKDVDYYRMDGTIIPEARSLICGKFNHPNNTKVKALIVSTRVGGLGLNLTAANRVIIMNVSWNPSNDTQSVFRAFRFGQEKPVFVYRLIAIDTMEEKIYQRVVTKLAVAHRVVDRHQITRHYTASDIQEYYAVRPRTRCNRSLPNVPEDRVLANLVRKYKVVFRWHEHQALLANRPEEDLNEQQKNAAWEEFYNKADQAPQVNRPVPDPLSGRHLPGPSGMQSKVHATDNASSARPGVSYKKISDTAITRVLNRLRNPWTSAKAMAVPQANGSNVLQNKPDMVLNPMHRWSKTVTRPSAAPQPSTTLGNSRPLSKTSPKSAENEVKQVNSLIKESLNRHGLNLIR